MTALHSKSSFQDGDTILLVDVASGSVASALMQLSKNDCPKLYGEVRVPLTVGSRAVSHEIAAKVQKAVDEVLGHVGHIAANLRQNQATLQLGTIKAVHVYFGAPWVSATVSHTHRALQFAFEDEILRDLYRQVGSIAGDSAVTAYPFNGAAAHATRAILNETMLVCILTGEVVELVVVEGVTPIAHATMPYGIHTIYRTLQSHAGLGTHAVQSLLTLTHQTGEPLVVYAEPLQAVAEHLTEEFVETATELVEQFAIHTIMVIADEHMGDWFARALTASTATVELFPNGGVVRALRPKHLEDYIATLAPNPDLSLMMEALYSNRRSA